MHADMHPGNILVRVVRPKSTKKSRPHVVFLDVGMTAELSSTDRVNLIEFFKSVALRDGRTAALSALRLSKNQKCPNPQAFIEVCFFFELRFQDLLKSEAMVLCIAHFGSYYRCISPFFNIQTVHPFRST